MKMSNKVTVLQSNYIPWKGFFDLISSSETLVIYDDVQFTKNDWRNRNKIKTYGGPTWLTVPVGQDINRNINAVEIPENSWQRKHWRTIMLNYQKQSGFSEYKDFFEDFYLNKKWQNLSEMNEYLIRNILNFLSITVNIIRSESYQLNGQKEDRLLDLLTKLEASDYYTGPTALNYINPEKFMAKSINLHIKQYGPYPEYQQPYGSFEHNVSVVDLLLCCGSKSKQYIHAID